MYRTRFSNRRNNKGTSLIETLAGSMFMIPIALFAIDVATLTLIEQLNDHLAQDAARAAANQLDEKDAKEAANKTVKMFPLSPLITNVDVTCVYKDGSVSAKTTMDARVPAPFWGLGGRKMVAAAVQPVVGIPAPL